MSDISYEIDNDGVAVVTWDLKAVSYTHLTLPTKA